MKIFENKQIGHKIKWNIFGIKVTFHLPPKRNYYISLGYNCFVRMVLTKFSMKASKEQGELSCPFDLCVTPLNSLAKILENDFSDFLDDIDYLEQGKSFVNTKYSIYFPHEDNLTLEDFKVRYKKRIENFRKISVAKSLKKYVFNCEQNDFTVEALNKIYDLLKIYCKGSPFKFYVLNFQHDNIPKVNLTGINPDINYKAFDVTEGFKQGWLGNFDWIVKNIDKEIFYNIMK